MKNNSKGFTLIEVLIAITLLSVLMVGVFTIVNNSTSTKERISIEDDEFLQLETALHRIELDFSHIYSPLFISARYTKQENSNKTSDTVKYPTPSVAKKYEANDVFSGMTIDGQMIPLIKNDEKSELVFMTSLNKRKHFGAKESHYAWVKYSLENNDIEDSEKKKADYMLVRQYSSLNPYQTDRDWDEVKQHVLIRNIKKFSFLFWDEEKREFVDRLRNTRGDQDLIRVIKVQVEWVESNGIENYTERTYRTLWPYFDTSKDLEEYIRLANKFSDENSDNDSNNEDL